MPVACLDDAAPLDEVREDRIERERNNIEVVPDLPFGDRLMRGDALDGHVVVVERPPPLL